MGDATVDWRLDLQYEGTAFHGWARQPELRTVQAEVEDALSTVLGSQTRVRVAGRTDAGVHAWGQVASFRSERTVEPRRLVLALNALLPEDVAVTGARLAAPGFDARAARSRTYRYHLWCGAARPVRERRYVWHVRGGLDPALLDALPQRLVGVRDWSACTPSADAYHTCVREVLAAGWCRSAAMAAGESGPSGELVFEITATSFVHNMVRVLVGTMVDMAQGRLTLREVEAALDSGERRRMGQTAPARGLALIRVEY